jgi:leader peptidase (prepilin peptidase)/N-methyltransferase
MAWVWLAIAFGLGLLFGSFLNVCIARLPYHESIVKPGSHCPGCLFPIRWYDNIPLLSFVLLRGRCRKCFQRIAWRYPLVELATALWFAWTAFAYLHATATSAAPLASVSYAGTAIFGWLLIGLVVMDWETLILPDSFTLTGAAIGFFLVCIQSMFLPSGFDDIQLHQKAPISSFGTGDATGNVFLTGPEHLVFGRLLAIFAVAGILWFFSFLYRNLRGREGMGRGDIKLMAMIAAFLGFWPAILSLFLGVIACAAYGVVLLVRKRAGAASKLAFGSFLAGAALFVAIFGERVLNWYMQLL